MRSLAIFAVVAPIMACGRLNFERPDARLADTAPDVFVCADVLCIDDTFGAAGIVLVDIDGIGNAAYGYRALGERPDGRLVVGGTLMGSSGRDLAVVGLLEDGSRDPAFGDNGVVGIDAGSATNEAINGLVVAPDETIVVVGASGGNEALLARLTADGAPDPSFATTGIIRTLAGGSSAAVFNGVALDGAGRIVAGGQARYGGGDYDFALHRRLPDGAPDLMFDGDGSLAVEASTSRDEFGALATIAPDGSYYVVGIAYLGMPGFEGAIVRVLPSGIPDPSFGTGGVVIANPTTSGADSVFDLAVDAMNRPIAVGSAVSDLYVARYTPAGVLDPSFAIGGELQLPRAEPSNLRAVTVLPDGRLVAGGYQTSGGVERAVVLVLDAAGNVLRELEPDVPAPSRVAHVRVDARGRLLVAGSAQITGQDVFVIRIVP